MSLQGYRTKLLVQGGLAVLLIGYVFYWTARFFLMNSSWSGEFMGPDGMFKLQFLMVVLALFLVVGLLFLRAAFNTRRFIRERSTPDV